MVFMINKSRPGRSQGLPAEEIPFAGAAGLEINPAYLGARNKNSGI
jgi:hypothetical protein